MWPGGGGRLGSSELHTLDNLFYALLRMRPTLPIPGGEMEGRVVKAWGPEATQSKKHTPYLFPKKRTVKLPEPAKFAVFGAVGAPIKGIRPCCQSVASFFVAGLVLARSKGPPWPHQTPGSATHPCGQPFSGKNARAAFHAVAVGRAGTDHHLSGHLDAATT